MPTQQMHVIINTRGRDFAPKQYFDPYAIISSRILTGSCWEDSQWNLGLNCLFRFVLTTLVLLNRSWGLCMPIQTNACDHWHDGPRFRIKTVFWQYLSHLTSILTTVQSFQVGFWRGLAERIASEIWVWTVSSDLFDSPGAFEQELRALHANPNKCMSLFLL
jgi:hypothetical protein